MSTFYNLSLIFCKKLCKRASVYPKALLFLNIPRKRTSRALKKGVKEGKCKPKSALVLKYFKKREYLRHKLAICKFVRVDFASYQLVTMIVLHVCCMIPTAAHIVMTGSYCRRRRYDLIDTVIYVVLT